jgi:hypothetical protein
MAFPERLQAMYAPSGGDHLNVRDVANDFKHWALVTAAATSTGRARPSQMAPQANFDFLRSPRGGQGLGDVLGFEVGILAKNFVARAASGDQPDDGSDRDPHPADARLAAHYGGVTSDARQLRQVSTFLVDVLSS